MLYKLQTRFPGTSELTSPFSVQLSINMGWQIDHSALKLEYIYTRVQLASVHHTLVRNKDTKSQNYLHPGDMIF